MEPATPIPLVVLGLGRFQGKLHDFLSLKARQNKDLDHFNVSAKT
jgi:hypothetical protein